MQIKKKFVALGIVIMLIGVAIVIHGTIEYNRWQDEYNKADDFDKVSEAAEKSFQSFAFIVIGAIITMSGIAVIVISHAPQIIRWITKSAAREVGKGMVEGKNKEIVKIRCHKCSTLNPENAQFCNNCGTRL